jgi:hypothetical protein
MLTTSQHSRKWATAVLLACLGWRGAAAEAQVVSAAPVPATAPGSAAAACGDDRRPPASPWAKVPPLSPPPRLGWYLLPPTGDGYYTALDCLKGNRRDSAPPNPYRFLFYDNDYRYLDEPCSEPVDCFDRLKRVPLGSAGCPWGHAWELSVGGEERYRLMNEVGSRLTAQDNRYDLVRSRVYGDLWYKDLFRVYAEYLDAQSFNQDLPPLPIDQGHSQIQNAFMDLKLATLHDNPLYGRVGRQELLYGSQRLLSPLDWTNTRRTFDGAKVFYRSEQFDLAGFWTRPVVNVPGRFNFPDNNRQFAGAFATYRPDKNQAIDTYYFYLDSDLRVGTGFAPGGRSGYDVNTVGGRWMGNKKAGEVCPAVQCSPLAGDVLWDFEAAYQIGDFSNRTISAGMATGGVGYSFGKLPMQPQFWVYYDWASGSDPLTGTGEFGTFDQLFPFGHYYFGYLDVVGRENIKDLNFQAACYPTRWITVLTQYHVFRLASSRDALYGPFPGFPIERISPAGRAGTNVGQELDLLGEFRLDRHNTILVGFSKLFAGDFIRQTGPSVNPELFYFQYSCKW